MLCINLQKNDPYFNLAIEELLLTASKEEYLLLYVNSPSVIIGKHQTGHREVNTRYITENHIPVIRRISGGGTVYHDYGNLNFSFIKQCEDGKQVDFRKYTEPVIGFLRTLGIEATFEGKNDLRVNGLKISGNAEHIHGTRILHHGTLLFNASLNILRSCIRTDTSHYSSRAVSSNPSSVANLEDKLGCFEDISEFRAEMLNYFLRTSPDAVPYKLTHEEVRQAECSALSKYHTWEWNWAYGPEYSFANTFNLWETEHSCNLLIKDGIIKESDIRGSDRMKEVSNRLVGRRHMVKDVSDAFRHENILLVENDIFNFF